MTPERLAALCAAALPDEELTVEDIETCCYGPGSTVVGDDDAAAVVYTRDFGEHGSLAWILLLVTHPRAQRRGRARALLERVRVDARRARASELHAGNAAPRYVWPGIPTDLTPAMAAFQALGFVPYDHGCNMVLPTSFRAPPPQGVLVGREQPDGGDGAVALARRAFPHWEDEVARGVEHGTTFAARDERTGDAIGFGCHSVNRRGWVGPMATDPQARGRGVGHALLAAIAEDLARAGHPSAEIAWVAPIPFYAKAGATISRTFRIARCGL